MKEIWKDIDGYEGLYQISNLGSIQVIHGELGYNNTSITECCKRIRKTAYGYKWRFAE